MMINLEKEFRDRSVLVTGADGFIGSHLTEKLLEYGADVHVFVRKTSSGGLNNIQHLSDKLKIFRGNLEDPHSTQKCMKILKDSADRPMIFHLGAQAHVGESWERPYETMMTNVISTLNLLQAIVDLDFDIFKFNTAGTSEEYGGISKGVLKYYDLDGNGDPLLNEYAPVNPRSIYATSKLAADFLTRNYYYAYGVPGVVTRMFNNYGPRQNPRYVTGTIITQALCRDKILLGNLDAERDLCYVDDGVRGHLYVTLTGTPGEVYCYGYGKNISIGDWADLIIKVGIEEGCWKNNKKILSVKERYRPGRSDVPSLRVGYDKLFKETGWEPLISWEEGLRKTIKWYAENKDRWITRVDWL